MNRIRDVARLWQLHGGNVLLKHRIEFSKAPCFPPPTAYYIADVSGSYGTCVWPSLSGNVYFTLPTCWRPS